MRQTLKSCLHRPFSTASKSAKIQKGIPFQKTWLGHDTRVAMLSTLAHRAFTGVCLHRGPQYETSSTDIAEGFFSHLSVMKAVFGMNTMILSSPPSYRAPPLGFVMCLGSSLPSINSSCIRNQTTPGPQIGHDRCQRLAQSPTAKLLHGLPPVGGGLSRATEDNAAAYFALVATAAQDPTDLAGSATIGMEHFCGVKCGMSTSSACATGSLTVDFQVLSGFGNCFNPPQPSKRGHL